LDRTSTGAYGPIPLDDRYGVHEVAECLGGDRGTLLRYCASHQRGPNDGEPPDTSLRSPGRDVTSQGPCVEADGNRASRCC